MMFELAVGQRVRFDLTRAAFAATVKLYKNKLFQKLVSAEKIGYVWDLPDMENDSVYKSVKFDALVCEHHLTRGVWKFVLSSGKDTAMIMVESSFKNCTHVYEITSIRGETEQEWVSEPLCDTNTGSDECLQDFVLSMCKFHSDVYGTCTADAHLPLQLCWMVVYKLHFEESEFLQKMYQNCSSTVKTRAELFVPRELKANKARKRLRQDVNCEIDCAFKYTDISIGFDLVWDSEARKKRNIVEFDMFEHWLALVVLFWREDTKYGWCKQYFDADTKCASTWPNKLRRVRICHTTDTKYIFIISLSGGCSGASDDLCFVRDTETNMLEYFSGDEQKRKKEASFKLNEWTELKSLIKKKKINVNSAMLLVAEASGENIILKWLSVCLSKTRTKAPVDAHRYKKQKVFNEAIPENRE
jgi:hypothetical protein